MAEKSTQITQRGEGERGLARRQGSFEDPFRMMGRFATEIDRVFDDVLGRGWLTPRFGGSWLRSPSRRELEAWLPDIEIFRRNNELVIRADLPGLTKDDIKVDVTENRITLQGERKREQEEEKGGVYRSERSYGSFYREIPLPEGTVADQAKATFKDGVLEITMPAPPEHPRQRRLEITEQTSSTK
jgi:HSP20 family protein